MRKNHNKIICIKLVHLHYLYIWCMVTLTSNPGTLWSRHQRGVTRWQPQHVSALWSYHVTYDSDLNTHLFSALKMCYWTEEVWYLYAVCNIFFQRTVTSVLQNVYWWITVLAVAQGSVSQTRSLSYKGATKTVYFGGHSKWAMLMYELTGQGCVKLVLNLVHTVFCK
jgi:hypothetical protein